MFEQIRKLIGHSLVYGVGVLCSGISMLVVTPMFLHRLPREEYGAVEVLNTYSSMLVVALLLGMASVFIKVYMNDCRSEDERITLVSSIVALTLALGGLVVGVSFLFPEMLSNVVLGSDRYILVVRLASCYGALLLTQSVIMLSLRAKQLPGQFVGVSVVQLALLASLNLYLVWQKNMGILGIQIAGVTSASIATLFGLFWIRSLLRFRLSARQLRSVLLLAIPVIPVSIAPWILGMSNRYFLRSLCGLSDTGLYAVGDKLGAVGMMVAINAFQLAWSPLFFANSESEDAKELCANVWKYFVCVLIFLAVVFSVFARDIVRVIAEPQYWSAYTITPYIAASYLFYGLHFFTVPLFIHKNRGGILSIIMGGVAAANILLNYFLIGKYGMRGAVITALISYSLLAIADTVLVNRYYPVKFPYLSLAKAGAAAVGLYLIYSSVQIGDIGTALVKGTVIILFPAALLAVGFFDRREKSALCRLWSSVFR